MAQRLGLDLHALEGLLKLVYFFPADMLAADRSLLDSADRWSDGSMERRKPQVRI